MSDFTCTTPLRDDRVPDIDLRGAEWFDGDSDGPYPLEHVEAVLALHPHLAHEFHVTSRPDLNYGVLLPERLERIRCAVSDAKL